MFVAFFPNTSHYKFFERPLWEEQRPQISLQQTMQTLRQPAGLRSVPPTSKAPSEERGRSPLLDWPDFCSDVSDSVGIQLSTLTPGPALQTAGARGHLVHPALLPQSSAQKLAQDACNQHLFSVCVCKGRNGLYRGKWLRWIQNLKKCSGCDSSWF